MTLEVKIRETKELSPRIIVPLVGGRYCRYWGNDEAN